MLVIDFERKVQGGCCRAGDIAKYGLIEATRMYKKKNKVINDV